MPSAETNPERLLDEWVNALDAVRSDPALSFTFRRICLLPPTRRISAASELAVRMRRGNERVTLIGLVEALRDPRIAQAVLAVIPDTPPPKRSSTLLWIFLATSLLLHPILITLFILLWLWFGDIKPDRDIPPARAMTVTLVPQLQPTPPPPPETNPNTPFLDTTGLPQLQQPDPRAAFEGETNTAALSRLPGQGNPALPNQQGDVRPGIELFNADYSPENLSQPTPPPTPDSPQEKPPTPDTPQPREATAAKPNAPLQDTLKANANARIQTGEKTEAQKIDKQEQEKAEQASPTATESRAPPAAFSAFKRQNRIEGGASTGDTNSAAAKETEIGRYKAKLYRAIGSRWYAYVRQDDGKIGVGVVRLRFYVRQDGVILPPEVIEGNIHAPLIAVSRRSVMEVSGQLEPFSNSMRQQLGDGYYEEVSFSIY
jgi:outer membrane biosynthesis protein TonB